MQLERLTKSFGERTLFTDVSIALEPGMRLAIVGPNGSGKSTLLRILRGEEVPDQGAVRIPPGRHMGFVTQEIEPDLLHLPLKEYVLLDVPKWGELWEKMSTAKGAELAALSARQEEMERRFGYHPERIAERMLTGLGFSCEEMELPLSAVSGGMRERTKLARAMVMGTDILLLDEPTNHLDLEGVLWLERFLSAHAGILILVAHDRTLLEAVSTHTLVLGRPQPVLKQGRLSEVMEWMAEKEALESRQAAQLRQERAHLQSFVDRFRAKATKATQAQSRVKRIEKVDAALRELEPVRGRNRRPAFAWPEPERANTLIAEAKDMELALPSGRRLLENISFSLQRGERIALVGRNGAGKSTLLKVLAGEASPTAGRLERGSKVRVGFFHQHAAERLRPTATVLQEMRRMCDPATTEQELRSVLGRFLLGETYWDRATGSLSGGEKSRLVMAGLFLSRANLLLLDEPTNHLDIESRQALTDSLAHFSGTLLVVAHDRDLLRAATASVWEVNAGQLRIGTEDVDSYLSRRESEAEAEACPAEVASQGRGVLEEESSGAPVRSLSKKEQAEVRNRYFRLLKPLNEEYAELEKELEEHLGQLSLLEERLADPTTYEGGADVAELQREHAWTNRAGEKAMARMEEIETEREALETRKEQELAQG